MRATTATVAQASQVMECQTPDNRASSKVVSNCLVSDTLCARERRQPLVVGGRETHDAEKFAASRALAVEIRAAADREAVRGGDSEVTGDGGCVVRAVIRLDSGQPRADEGGHQVVAIERPGVRER